jgi:hypothetical protein
MCLPLGLLYVGGSLEVGGQDADQGGLSRTIPPDKYEYSPGE